MRGEVPPSWVNATRARTSLKGSLALWSSCIPLCEDVIRTALLAAGTLILDSTVFRALRKQPSVSRVFCSSCENETETIYGHISSSAVKGGMNVYYYLLNQFFYKKNYMRKSALLTAPRVLYLNTFFDGTPYIDSDHLFFCEVDHIEPVSKGCSAQVVHILTKREIISAGEINFFLAPL